MFYTFLVHTRGQLGREDYFLIYEVENMLDAQERVCQQLRDEGGVLPVHVEIIGPIRDS